MNAFNGARLVESRGMAILGPYLEEISDGRLILLEKGTLAEFIQECIGDGIFRGRGGTAWSVEIKVEERETGNLFLETWSNRNLEDRASHMARGSNPGWMVKLRADWLFYYFLDTDRLYIIDMFALQQWAWGSGDKRGRLCDYKERPQGKRAQMNDTWGRIVPLAHLRKEVGYTVVKPKLLLGSGVEAEAMLNPSEAQTFGQPSIPA